MVSSDKSVRSPLQTSYRLLKGIHIKLQNRKAKDGNRIQNNKVIDDLLAPNSLSKKLQDNLNLGCNKNDSSSLEGSFLKISNKEISGEGNSLYTAEKLSKKYVDKFSYDVGPSKPSRMKLRRIHSMYASKVELDDDLTSNDSINTQKTSNFTHGRIYDSQLAKSNISFHYQSHKTDHFPRITGDTLISMLNKDYSSIYSKIFIVDCRFEYEYQGGHIIDSVNLSSQKELEQYFIHNRSENCYDEERPNLVVFYCEFSSYRGPIMASHLRNCDRVLNYDDYPKLHYPDIFILEGGYKLFYDKYPERCNGKYVEMSSEKHESVLLRFKRDSKKLITRENSLHYLKNNTQSEIDLKFKAPPKLNLDLKRNNSRNLYTNSSSSSINSRMLLLDELDGNYIPQGTNNDLFTFQMTKKLYHGDSSFENAIKR